MKKIILKLVVVLVIVVLGITAVSCGGGSEDSASETGKTTEGKKETPEVVKSIDGIDENIDVDLPLQVESVMLLDDGTVRIVPLGDLKENAENNGEMKDGAIYPFEETGIVKDIFLVRLGNGGYRTVIALMDDGSLAALNAKSLVEDSIAVVRPDIAGRNDFVSVEQTEEENGYGVIGVTKSGEEVQLDFSLVF